MLVFFLFVSAMVFGLQNLKAATQNYVTGMEKEWIISKTAHFRNL